ncbi:MAG: hypothetical protein FWD61_03790 [Phycisphaerales bacterium]|nr:hypothetical protein [Phycisphaerales bacterium]
MKTKLKLILAAILTAGLVACNGVQLSATYSERLDTAAAAAAESYKRMQTPEDQGGLTRTQATQVIGGVSDFLKLLRDARDGKASSNSTPVTNP